MMVKQSKWISTSHLPLLLTAIFYPLTRALQCCVFAFLMYNFAFQYKILSFFRKHESWLFKRKIKFGSNQIR